MQAQCILFRRYPEVLEPFKYAGYPMLLQAVALPQQEHADDPAAHFLSPQQAPRLQVTSCSCCTKLSLLPQLQDWVVSSNMCRCVVCCLMCSFACVESLPFLLTLPSDDAAWGG